MVGNTVGDCVGGDVGKKVGAAEMRATAKLLGGFLIPLLKSP